MPKGTTKQPFFTTIAFVDSTRTYRLFAVMRHLDILKAVVASLSLLYAIKERLERPVYCSNYLLTYTCLQETIVLVSLTFVVVRLILQELFCIKVMLPDAVQPDIIQIVQ
jgi:hypothetical protein